LGQVGWEVRKRGSRHRKNGNTTQEWQDGVQKITGGSFEGREKYKNKKNAVQCKMGEKCFFWMHRRRVKSGGENAQNYTTKMTAVERNKVQADKSSEFGIEE